MSDTVFPEDMPERPDDLLRALGLDEPTPGVDVGVLGQIKRDLKARQGPHRRRTLAQKIWPVLLAAVVGAVLFVVLAPNPAAGTWHFLASGLAGLAGWLCLMAAAVAPDKPATGERVALFGLVAAAGALVVEGALAAQMTRVGLDMGLTCAVTAIVAGVVPMGLVLFAIKRSGLPLRALHAAAVVGAGLALSGASVWLHCAADNLWHLLSGHMVLPALVAAALAVLVFRLLNRERTLS